MGWMVRNCTFGGSGARAVPVELALFLSVEPNLHNDVGVGTSVVREGQSFLLCALDFAGISIHRKQIGAQLTGGTTKHKADDAD